jgi:hypothetical protein
MNPKDLVFLIRILTLMSKSNLNNKLVKDYIQKVVDIIKKGHIYTILKIWESIGGDINLEFLI